MTTNTSKTTLTRNTNPWRVHIIKASKARKHTRIWAKGPERQSAGWFSTVDEAQAYCDRQNARPTTSETGNA